MARQYSFPNGHWDWPVKLTHHHGVRAGDLVFTGGQVDLDARGAVRNIGDLPAQCHNAMAYMARLLEDLGTRFDDLVRLVVYYVGNAA
ncbi:MAG: Rid family hydrolase, partial [Pseudomonadota bacterium]